MLVSLLSSAALAGVPFGGVEWHPISRADLVWVDEGRTSGVAVGEYDGSVKPALSGFLGGELSSRVALTGSVGVARLSTTTLVGDVLRTVSWGVIRPGIDVRWSLAERAAGRPHGFVLAGGHGNIPTARDASNGYTDQEQEDAKAQSLVERQRLGGFGGRIGIGAEVRLVPGLWLGAQQAFELHHNTWRSEDISEVGSWFAADAALLLTFYGPGQTP